MNPVDPNRGDLLDDLFSESSSPAALDELLTAIHREKRRRVYRQRAIALGTSFVMLVTFAMFHSWLPVPAPVATTAVPSETPAGLASEPFQVERVDDEGLLKLLDNTPAAMVHWPNGQRALMLLVQTSPRE